MEDPRPEDGVSHRSSLDIARAQDKWAEPSTRAIKYWDRNDILKTRKDIMCNLWLSMNWKAELPKSDNARVIPTKVKRAVWVRDKGQCVMCGNNTKLEYDHIIPYSQGGSNTERNIQILCQECNRKKSNNIV
jgi:5-methylcytosine-specific restriction endonuclease McrA